MTKYLNHFKDTSSANVIYIEEYNHLVRGKKVVLVGDSSISQMSQSEIDLMIKANPDCTITNTGLSSRWTNVNDTVRAYSGDVDIWLLLAGSNDLVSNYTVADTLGAPDIAKQSGTPGDTTAFNSIRLTLDYIRANYPRSEIYCLQRANHPTKRRSAWYYFKYYEAAIMKEYGVPVIDTNDIINLTNWSPEQKAIYVKSDGLHYTAVMYQRYLTTLGYMLASNVTPSDMELPNCFYVPDSVINSSYPFSDEINAAECVKWVFQHCYTRAGGNQGQFLAGGAIVPSGGTNTYFYEFEGNAFYDADMLTMQHFRAIIKRPEHLILAYDESGQTVTNTIIMSQSFFDADSSRDLRYMAEGDYVFTGGAAQAATNFPAGNTSGGHVMIRRNKVRYGQSDGNPLYIFHAFTDNRLFIGTALANDTVITWAEIAKV